MLTEPIAVTLLVIDALETLRVPYFIGGSLASAVHGVIRATMDVDMIADLRLEHVETLVRILGMAPGRAPQSHLRRAPLPGDIGSGLQSRRLCLRTAVRSRRR